MQKYKADHLTNRLLSGQIKLCIGGQIYTVVPPTLDLLLEADLEYEKARELALFGFLTDDEARNLLIKRGLWTEESDANMVKLEEEIDLQKLAAYRCFRQTDFQGQKKLKQSLQKLKARLLQSQTIRYQFNSLTIDGHANSVKEEYILSRSVKSNDGPLDLSLVDFFLPKVLAELNKISLSIEDIREIARNEPWRTYWTLYNKDVFQNFPLIEEQKAVASFSQLYDNIHKHPECPSDAVIEDDDLLDGWLIHCRKENQGKQKGGPKPSSKIEQHAEVFQKAKSREDANAIYNQNDGEARDIVKKRLKVPGVVSEANLPDQQIRLQQLAIERTNDARKSARRQ